jgi:rod shape-determining protein MreC
MQNLLLFLIRYGNLLTFLFLESICLYLIVQNNEAQREIFVYSSNLASGKIYENVSDLKAYVGLKEVNQVLAKENALLRSILLSKDSTLSVDTTSEYFEGRYVLIPARVINNNVTGRNNTLTLDVGLTEGVEKSMGVIHPDGVVGVIRKVSSSYASVVSLLNTDLRISARSKRTNNFGTLRWNGEDMRYAMLTSIPKHADVMLGDTVATTSYSSIFPEDIPLGVVDNIAQPAGRGDFLITVRLFIDFSSLDHAYVVIDRDADEILDVSNTEGQ